MFGSTHRPATIPPGAQVALLRRQDEKANKIGPDTLVTVINRGREPLVRKWDGEDYVLPPFTADGGTDTTPTLRQMPYAAALHFQKHCPIPGTRDPLSNTLAAESFLGILDTDAPELCVPMTEDECQRAGQAIEAIERPAHEPTQVVEMKEVSTRKIGQAGLGTQTGARVDFDRTVAAEHMRPPEGVSDEIRSEAAAGEAEEAELAGVGGRATGRNRRARG